IRQRHVDNDPGVSTTSELFAMACGPTPTPILVNSYVVNDVRFVMHSRDERHTTQNSGICSPGGKDREMYYDALLHDLAYSDDEDLVNVDDGVDVVYSTDVARCHGGDSGGDDRPPTHHIPIGCGGCFPNRGKGTRKLNLGGRKAGRLDTRQDTRNLRLKKITDDKGPGDAFVLPFLVKGLGGAEGGDLDKGVPYTEEEINALARKGKQRGNLLSVGRLLPGRATYVLIPPPSPSPQCTHNSDDYESTLEFGNANGSGGCEDDEMANDEDGDKDEEDEDDGDS
nr:hypothetical protein [Tanacetum cinerariifolium]